MFTDEDIPRAWFSGPLTPRNRKKVIPLGPLGGGRFSVFAKIEIGEYLIKKIVIFSSFHFFRHCIFFLIAFLPSLHFFPHCIFSVIAFFSSFQGTCPQRREAIEKDLNETFQEFMDQEFRVDEGYSYMVCGRPSKVLSGWTYEAQPKPLRSSRTAGEFCETEVPETEDETPSHSSDFNEFSKLLLNGQVIANETNKNYIFVWRGYTACISAQLPKLSAKELDRRFNLAMESISKTKKDSSEALTQCFKKPAHLSNSSTSGPSSSSLSSRGSSDSISSEDLSQIPETQFDMEGNVNRWR